MKAFKRAWLHFPIAKKTRSFTMLVIIVIALAVIFNLIINSLSLTSLGGMVRAASAYTIAQEAMGEEVDALTKYVRQPRPGSRQALARAIEKTEKAISALPSDYEDIGPERYGRTWRVLNTYGEYAKHRDQIVTLTEREAESRKLVISSGTEVIEFSDGDIEKLREIVTPLYEQYCGEYMDLIERIRATE